MATIGAANVIAGKSEKVRSIFISQLSRNDSLAQPRAVEACQASIVSAACTTAIILSQSCSTSMAHSTARRALG